MTIPSRSRHEWPLMVLALAMPLASCSDAAGAAGSKPSARPKSHLLSIVGYNYSDQYIYSFEVNGAGGGNLELSTPTSWGQGNTCCVRWTEGSRLPVKVSVKWTASYCIQKDVTSVGEPFETREPLLKIADVEFNGPVPANPTNFEVHFYPDGHVETAITAADTPARLRLPMVETPQGQTRPGRTIDIPPCPPDYDRATAFRNPMRVDAATGRPLP
jgi:hypothetical protein